jgi:hypothetical protein
MAYERLGPPPRKRPSCHALPNQRRRAGVHHCQQCLCRRRRRRRQRRSLQRAGWQIVTDSSPPESTRRGTPNAPSGQCRGQISSRRIQNQQRSAAHHRSKSCNQLGQLANMCNRIRHLCNQGVFKLTDHKTIMGFLEKRASKFRKNGRLRGEDMEEFLERLQEEEGIEQAEEGAASARAAEQGAFKEAVYKGLLRPHGNPPNLKQHWIFRLLCENPNGLNNQIMDNPTSEAAPCPLLHWNFHVSTCWDM